MLTTTLGPPPEDDLKWVAKNGVVIKAFPLIFSFFNCQILTSKVDPSAVRVNHVGEVFYFFATAHNHIPAAKCADHSIYNNLLKLGIIQYKI